MPDSGHGWHPIDKATVVRIPAFIEIDATYIGTAVDGQPATLNIAVDHVTGFRVMLENGAELLSMRNP